VGIRNRIPMRERIDWRRRRFCAVANLSTPTNSSKGGPTIANILGFMTATALAAAQFPAGQAVPGQPFVRQVATATHSGRISYYLSPSRNPESPLLVLIQGSGCEPLFVQGKRGLRATAGQDIVNKAADGRLSIMVVEKTNVESEGAPATGGTANQCSQAFNQEHSLNRWANRISLAINDARRRRLADPVAPIFLMGLSEGAITAARLAKMRPDVGKVVFLSGFGCDQWRDVLVNARRNAEPGKEAAEVAKAEAGLREVASDPFSTLKIFDGQTHLFWTTFGSACPAADLLSSKAQVMVFTGTADEQIDGNGIEAISATFLHARKSIIIRRIFGGTHMLTTDPKQPLANLLSAFNEAVVWMAAN
jgi:pimeloyl-ACP methyl ester carboxylesterase